MRENNLSRLGLFAIVLGSIIGWGSFMLPGTKFLREAGVINTSIGLFLGAFGIIIIEKSYRIMLDFLQDEGGEFSYVYDNMGKLHGFIVGWSLLLAYLTMIPLNSTAFSLVIKKLFGNILEFGYLYSLAGYKVYLGEILASNFIVLIFAYINISGIKETSKAQNIIIFTLLSMVALVFTRMLLSGNRSQFRLEYIDNYRFSLGEISKILAITPFLFVGFDTIPQVSREFNFSNREAGRIAVISLLLASLIYSVLNIATGLAFGPEEAYRLDWALGTGVMTYLGQYGFLALVLALAAAVTSGINGFMLSTSKLMGGMANYQVLPPKYKLLNKAGVFKNTIKFATIISLIAPWFGREVILWIVDMSSVGAAIAYGYVAYVSYGKSPNKKDKIYSILGLLISISFVVLLLFPLSPAFLDRESLVFLFLWILLGGIFYRTMLAKQA